MLSGSRIKNPWRSWRAVLFTAANLEFPHSTERRCKRNQGFVLCIVRNYQFIATDGCRRKISLGFAAILTRVFNASMGVMWFFWYNHWHPGFAISFRSLSKIVTECVIMPRYLSGRNYLSYSVRESDLGILWKVGPAVRITPACAGITNMDRISYCPN